MVVIRGHHQEDRSILYTMKSMFEKQIQYEEKNFTNLVLESKLRRLFCQ